MVSESLMFTLFTGRIVARVVFRATQPPGYEMLNTRCKIRKRQIIQLKPVWIFQDPGVEMLAIVDLPNM